MAPEPRRATTSYLPIRSGSGAGDDTAAPSGLARSDCGFASTILGGHSLPKTCDQMIPQRTVRPRAPSSLLSVSKTRPSVWGGMPERRKEAHLSAIRFHATRRHVESSIALLARHACASRNSHLPIRGLLIATLWHATPVFFLSL